MVPGWAVDLWTILVPSWPTTAEQWRSVEQESLDELLRAGYAVAWYATEGDFVDPPHLFDPDLMGDGVYAAATDEHGFVARDDDGDLLLPLSRAELVRIRSVAVKLWSSPSAAGGLSD